MREEFTYGGVHCDTYNVGFKVEKWPVAAKSTINKYTIAGRHGTIRYASKTYGEQFLKGKLYLLDDSGEVISYAAMLTRKTSLAAWLCQEGRKQLILDAAPDRYYMAEVEEELTISTDEWGNGCIPITFTLQPFAYQLTPATAIRTLAANTAASLSMTVAGSMPAPIELELTANAALTWVELTANGKTLRLENMSLTTGQKVLISYDLTCGELLRITCAGTSGMRYLKQTSPEILEALPGNNAISVKSSAAANAIISVRGRWR